MTKKEKEMLKQTINHPSGLLSPAEYINGVCKKDKRSAYDLVSLGYIEQVPQKIHTGQEYLFFKPTEKGLSVFYPIHKRAWYFIKEDIRTIIVAVVISLITTLLTLLLTNIFIKH